jgi:hypothetical protein
MNIAQNVRSNYSIISLLLFLIQLMIPTIEYLDYDFSSVSFDQNIQLYKLQYDRLQDMIIYKMPKNN